MFRMTLITLASIYLVLVIAGHDGATPGPQDTRVADATAGQASIAGLGLVAADKIDLVTPAAYTEEPAPAAPSVTPVRLPMPGPALRPSPEYRPQDVPVTVAGGTLWEVNSSSANVRSGPSTSEGVIDRIGRGEQVLVIAESNGWVKIRIEGDGVDGWVSKKLLRPAR